MATEAAGATKKMDTILLHLDTTGSPMFIAFRRLKLMNVDSFLQVPWKKTWQTHANPWVKNQPSCGEVGTSNCWGIEFQFRQVALEPWKREENPLSIVDQQTSSD